MFGIFKRLRELESKFSSIDKSIDRIDNRIYDLKNTLKDQGIWKDVDYPKNTVVIGMGADAPNGRANPVELRDQLHALAKKLGYEIVENEAPTKKYKVRKVK